jgi:YggT family protein
MSSALTQIAALLIDATCGVLVYLALLRFLMQWRRASFYNPLGSFVLGLTDWAVRPIRRVIPISRGIDWATLLVALATEMVIVLARSHLHLIGPASELSPLAWVCVSLVWLCRDLLGLLIFLAIVDVLMAWLNPSTPIAPVVATIVRPFAQAVRRFVQPIGGIDLAPWVLVVGLDIGMIALGQLALIVRQAL